MDLGFTWFQEGLLDFIQHVLSHDLVVELSFSLTVEAETTNFTLDVTLVGLIAIILGTTRHKFDDVIILFQFICKIAEVGAQVWVGLSFVCVVDDGVCVVVQDPFSQGLQGLVEFKRALQVVKQALKMLRLGETGMSSFWC